jgi:diguanylate cyclase (GGDEF)-like protein
VGTTETTKRVKTIEKNSHSTSIKAFLLKISIFFSALGFIVIFLTANQAYQHSIKQSSYEAAEQIAKTTFDTISQFKQRGWNTDDIQTFIDKQQQRYKNYTIELLFPKQLENLTLAEPENKLLLDVVESNTAQSQQQSSILSFAWPLIADNNCINCPQDAEPDRVFAIVRVNHDISNLISEAQNRLLTNLIYISPFPIFLALFVIAYLNKRINNSVKSLEASIDQINRVSDLSNMNLQNDVHTFSELNHIYGKVEKLSEKLHDLAVDKDLLKFEIQLLEKFVITSEVVKDWREYVNLLLIEINEVMHVYNLFSIFKVDDEMYALEVFWLRPPSDNTKRWLNEKIEQTLSNHPVFCDQFSMDVKHHVANADGEVISMKKEEIQLQTKSLVLDKPKIGGIVGIGVNSEVNNDSTRQLVTSSILSTLINVVGSVKAIYKYTQDLEYYATRDPLTNLHNQRIFWEMLDYEVIRAQRHEDTFTVLMIDMDNFKAINDNFGHGFGDKTLQTVSQAIRNALRSGDFLARYGGDEFAIILPESDIEQAQVITTRILENIHNMELQTTEGEMVDAAMSIGIAIYPDHAVNSRELFMFADNMMYKAKSAGKDRTYIPNEDDILEVFRDLNEKSVMINRAIKDRTVIPYFQPLLELESGQVGAVEVLCRIKLSDGGIMGAHEFIEIAEKMGIIHNLDFIMLEKALQQTKIENYQGLVFVNISPRSLVLSEFIPEVIRIVNQTQIARERIVFEITERDTVKNMTLLKKFVINLKSEGFKLAVDDFGSGFSSFHYLKHFPIDFVKIDGEFVANMIHNPKDHAVVRCISNLAHELNAQTIAEYVESKEVLDAVKSVGITFAQGYHIRQPTPYIMSPDLSSDEIEIEAS